MFQFVLRIAADKKLLSGKTVGVDSTTLEANAAMKSIVRRDTGEDWKQYVTRLMREDGTIEADEEPTDEEVRRYDKKRKNKRVSNEDWVSRQRSREPHHADEGRPHAPGLQGRARGRSGKRHRAGGRDSPGRPGRYRDAGRQRDGGAEQLNQAGSQAEIEEVAADKGYHAAHTLELCRGPGIADLHSRAATQASPALDRQAGGISTRRVRQPTPHQAGQEQTLAAAAERTCANGPLPTCATRGGMRRSWLKGVAKVTKRYLIAVAAHNLGRILRKLFGVGKPRALQGEGGLAALVYLLAVAVMLVGEDCWRRESDGTVGWVGLTG